MSAPFELDSSREGSHVRHSSRTVDLYCFVVRKTRPKIEASTFWQYNFRNDAAP